MAGPGRPKTGGRQSGTPNKLTRDLRDMVLSALDKAGGVEYLVEQVRANPAPFLTLVGEATPRRSRDLSGVTTYRYKARPCWLSIRENHTAPAVTDQLWRWCLPRTVRSAKALLSRLARIIPDGGSTAP